MNKYNIQYDNIFKNIGSNYIDNFPQNDYWSSYNFYSSYRHSRKLNNKWAIGFGLTVDKVFRENFKFNNNNNLDNNIRAEFQLSHRINKKTYIGLGGILAKKPFDRNRPL